MPQINTQRNSGEVLLKMRNVLQTRKSIMAIGVGRRNKNETKTEKKLYLEYSSKTQR
jgi:hypothetical protein